MSSRRQETHSAHVPRVSSWLPLLPSHRRRKGIVCLRQGLQRRVLCRHNPTMASCTIFHGPCPPPPLAPMAGTRRLRRRFAAPWQRHVRRSRGARRDGLRQRHQADLAPSRPSEENNLVAIFPNTCLCIAILDPPRGALRDRHETWGLGMRWPQACCSGLTGSPTNGRFADVKTRGPGAPMLAPSRRAMIPRATVAKEPDTGEIAT